MSTEMANVPEIEPAIESNELKRPREEDITKTEDEEQQPEEPDVNAHVHVNGNLNLNPPPPLADDAGDDAGDGDENIAESESPLPSSKGSAKRSKNSNKGRHGDPRMHRAVAARLLNPELSLLEALLEGGFLFPEGTEGSGKSDRNIFDSDGVLLCQRKNQLSRRLRLAKKRQQASRADGNMFSSGPGSQSQGDSRTLQNMLLNGQLPITGNEMPMMPPPYGPPYYPGPPGQQMDPNARDANGKRQVIDSNLDQYLQHTARSMGIRPEQLQQQLRAYPSQGMFPGFPPFQHYPGMPQQGQYMPPPPPPMDQQQQQQQNANSNSAPQPNNGAPHNGAPQNMSQMPPMMTMQQQQYNQDLSRMLLNRSLIMNAMEQQNQQPQALGQQNQDGSPENTLPAVQGEDVANAPPLPIPEQQQQVQMADDEEDIKI
jgi:hypothetical protein